MLKDPSQSNPCLSGRIIGFDFLRGIAILLTLFRHTYNSGNVLYEIGWISVHIFFVLSSFLITDILLKEYFRNGKVNYLRFFVRRGLKIYPLYYLFLIISVVNNGQEIFHSKEKIMSLIGQVFLFQNYVNPLWYHTWSLAAEEHFYVAICMLFVMILKFYRQTFVKKLVIFYFLIIVVAVYLRYLACLHASPTWFQQTHLIMDSFAFGGLLAVSKYAYPAFFYTLLSMKHYLLIPIIILLIPMLVYPLGSWQLNTFGHSAMYFSFTLVLAYLISIEQYSREKNIYSFLLVKPIAWFGIASYSIYLFHSNVRSVVNNSSIPAYLKIPVYVIISIILGKFLWWIIEKPIMNLKGKYFNVPFGK